MPPPVIPTLPAYPVRGESQTSFAEKANATVAAMPTVVTKQNELGDWMDGVAAEVEEDRVESAASAEAAELAYQQTVAVAATYTTIHQGAHPSAPTTRNDGSPLQVGDLYYNTTTGKLQVWGS